MRSLLWIVAGLCFASITSAKPVGCFAIAHMYESEDHRYFIDARSHCKSELDVVYVRVAFLSQRGREIAHSFWSLRMVRPGVRERHEFAYPRSAEGFFRIKLLEVVTTLEEAMK